MDTDMPQRSPALDPPATPPSPRRERHAGHVIAIVVGCLLLLPGLAFLIGGGAAASGQAFATDDGYFRFTPDRIRTDGVAVAATDLFFDDGADDDAPDWLLDTLDLDVRLRVTGAAPTDEIFVGIARTADLERYLSGASYSEIVDVDGHAPRYDEIAGTTPVGTPTSQEFWAVSAVGDGERTVEWNARGGHWSVALMNADGSPAVAGDIEIGVRAGALMPIAITLMVVGVIVVVGAVVLIVVGARGRRVPGIDGTGDRAASFPPPAPTDAARIDEDHRAPAG